MAPCSEQFFSSVTFSKMLAAAFSLTTQRGSLPRLCTYICLLKTALRFPTSYERERPSTHQDWALRESSGTAQLAFSAQCQSHDVSFDFDFDLDHHWKQKVLAVAPTMQWQSSTDRRKSSKQKALADPPTKPQESSTCRRKSSKQKALAAVPTKPQQSPRYRSKSPNHVRLAAVPTKPREVSNRRNLGSAQSLRV